MLPYHVASQTNETFKIQTTHFRKSFRDSNAKFNEFNNSFRSILTEFYVF